MTFTVKLADATEAQLRQIAQEQLGISVHPSAKPDTIRAKIQAATDKTEFAVTVGKVERPAPKPVETADPSEPVPEGYTAPIAEPIYTITINKEEGPEGETPVPVSVNGRNMWIPRGAPARIKHRHYHALMNAERTVFDQPEGPKGPMVERQVLSYPVQVIAAPSQAELDAWAKYKADVQKMEVAAKVKKVA